MYDSYRFAHGIGVIHISMIVCDSMAIKRIIMIYLYVNVFFSVSHMIK